MSHSVEDFQKMREGGNPITRGLLLRGLVAVAIWWQFIRPPQDVEITNMVAGLNIAMSGLECWVTLDFDEAPASDSHMPLVATVYRGGQRQDRVQRSVGRADRSDGAPL